MPYKVMTIRVSKDLKDQLDQEWKDKGFENRTEYIRYLLNKATNMNGLRKKMRRLREDGKELIDEGEKKLKEAEYLENKSQTEVGDGELIREDLIDIIKKQYRNWENDVYANKAIGFVYAEIPEMIDGEITWNDEDKAANILITTSPQGDVDNFQECAEEVVDKWIEEGLFNYNGE